MSVRIDTYSLLVDKFGEETAYKICEELGGTTIEIPKKQHKTFRARKLAEIFLPLLREYPFIRTILVKRLKEEEEISECSVYRIIREVEYGK